MSDDMPALPPDDNLSSAVLDLASRARLLLRDPAAMPADFLRLSRRIERFRLQVGAPPEAPLSRWLTALQRDVEDCRSGKMCQAVPACC